MPLRVQAQIDFLCEKISTVEWSGVLFAKITGDITKPLTIKIDLVDVFPMDKGTTGYTSYDLGPEVFHHKMDHPFLCEPGVVMGHIHSHHSMNTFFSGTDMSELEDNAGNYAVYLSLIVNNRKETTCKLAFVAKKSVHETFKAVNIDGSEVDTEVNIPEGEYLLSYDCDVIREAHPSPVVDEVFMKQFTEINKFKFAQPGFGGYGGSTGVGFRTSAGRFAAPARRGFNEDFYNEDAEEESPIYTQKKISTSQDHFQETGDFSDNPTEIALAEEVLLQCFVSCCGGSTHILNIEVLINTLGDELDLGQRTVVETKKEFFEAFPVVYNQIFETDPDRLQPETYEARLINLIIAIEALTEDFTDSALSVVNVIKLNFTRMLGAVRTKFKK